MSSDNAKFRASLGRLKDNGILTDIELLLSDNSTIRCHKIVLAAACAYFESMFTSAMESSQQEVEMLFPDADTMRTMVDYFYSGEIEVNAVNFKALAASSGFLCLDGLKEQCQDFF